MFASSLLDPEDLRRVERRGQMADRILARTQIAMRQLEPAPAMNPLWSDGIRPERTSDDLPLPDVPTTERKRVVRSRRSSSSISFSRPKKR